MALDQYTGCVDDVVNGVLGGWALNRNEPTSPCPVDVYVNSRRVGQFLADRERNDLAAVSPQDIKKGFSIDLKGEYGDDDRVEVYFGNTNVRVPVGRHAGLLGHGTLDPGQFFSGFIEQLSPRCVSGWGAYTIGETRHAPTFTLRFRTLGTFSPTRLFNDRADGLPGFVFDLPSHFGELGWRRFIDEFQSLDVEFIGEDGPHRSYLPILKNALLHGGNSTTLYVDQLRSYSIEPRPNGRIAALTTVYNEDFMLPMWAKYYAKEFGAENLFVIDHASDPPASSLVPAGVNVIRIPFREELDNFLVARLVGLTQRLLLEAYDCVAYSDVDEFLCAEPGSLAGRGLRQFLLEMPGPVGKPISYDLWHDVASEDRYEPGRPILEQRRVIARAPYNDKPLVSRVPLSWTPGFHTAHEGGRHVDGLYMLHLRWFDLGHALRRAEVYRASKWSADDLQTGRGQHARAEAEAVQQLFHDMAVKAESLRGSSFDPQAGITVVPPWMCETLFLTAEEGRCLPQILDTNRETVVTDNANIYTGFSGFIEQLSPWCVSGWGAYTIGETRHAPTFTLRFRTLGTFSPTRLFNDRADGLPGFVFDLPGHFGKLGWSEFIDEFQSLDVEFIGEDGPHRSYLPILKDALVHAGNRTTPYVDQLLFLADIQRELRLGMHQLQRAAHNSEQRHRDLLERLLRIYPLAAPRATLKTDHPVAIDSDDHRFPNGTRNDNSRRLRFVRACERLYAKPVRHLDLGCSGGGSVWDFLLSGHISYGIEGSDYSRLEQRAEWRSIPEYLFTADITKPFRVVGLHGEGLKFDVITAWEVMEHIGEQQLPQLLDNIDNHLAPEGVFVASISTVPDMDQRSGAVWHLTVKPFEWWDEQFTSRGFVQRSDLFAQYDFVRGVGNPTVDDHDLNSYREAGFHAVYGRPRS